MTDNQDNSEIDSEILIRCSSLSKIMGKSKAAITELQQTRLDKLIALGEEKLTEKLTEEKATLLKKKAKENEISQTAKSYLLELFASKKYGRRNILQTDAIYKGLNLEEKSIDDMLSMLGILTTKNTERKNNSFIVGESDVAICLLEGENTIYDIKNKESLLTFLKLTNKDGDEEEEDKKTAAVYWWQMQGYMELWNASSAHILHFLQSAPEGMVIAKIQSAFWNVIKYEHEFFKNGLVAPTSAWASDFYDIAHFETDEIISILRDNNRLTNNDEIDLAMIKEGKQTYLNYHFDNLEFGYIPQEKRIFEEIIYRDEPAMRRAEIQILKCRKYYSTIKMGKMFSL